MKVFRPVACMALAFAAAATAAAFAGEKVWTRYRNPRYGYVIDYPAATFRPERGSDNGDGRSFRSIHGDARFMVWAGHPTKDDSPRRFVERQSATCLQGRAHYAVKSRTMAVVSCERRGEIFYAKELFGRRLLTGFQMTYPVSERQRWDMALARMAESLTGGARD